jgi:DNA repair exonuclease SbcCD ATPase subunit
MADDRLKMMQANLEAVLSQLEDKAREVVAAQKEATSQRDLANALTKKIDVRAEACLQQAPAVPLRAPESLCSCHAAMCCTTLFIFSSPASLMQRATAALHPIAAFPPPPAMLTPRVFADPGAFLPPCAQAVSKRNKQLEKEMARATAARETLTDVQIQTDPDAALLAANARASAAAEALAESETKAAREAATAAETAATAAAEAQKARESASAGSARIAAELEAAVAAAAAERAAAATAAGAAAAALERERKAREQAEGLLAVAEGAAAPREAEVARARKRLEVLEEDAAASARACVKPYTLTSALFSLPLPSLPPSRIATHASIPRRCPMP